MIRYNQKGFTLVELLVVISIFSAVASTTLAVSQQGRVKARDAQRISNLKQIKTALELYYAANDSYPTSMGEFGATTFSIYSTWNDQLGVDLSPYLTTLPHDPKEPSFYFYYFSGPQSTWCLPISGGRFLKISEDRGYMLVTYLEDANNTLPQNDGGAYSDRYELLGGNAQIVNSCP
jgi:type IV pilus assembly protein PilA